MQPPRAQLDPAPQASQPELVGPARPCRLPGPSGLAAEVGTMTTSPFRLRRCGLEMLRNLSPSHIAGEARSQHFHPDERDAKARVLNGGALGAQKRGRRGPWRHLGAC